MTVKELLSSISLFFNKHLFIQIIMSTYSDHRENIVQHFWRYQDEYFSDWEEYFERPFRPDGRPPVFHKKAADNNVIFNPDSFPQERA